jgi:hypothetical protein
MIKKLYIPLALVAGTILFSACKREEYTVVQAQGVNGMAFLKLVNVYTALTPSATSPASGPSVNVFVNGVRINPPGLSYGALFPATANYAEVAPALGSNILVVLNRATGPIAGDTLINKNFDIAAGSYTSLYIVDTLPNPNPNTASPTILPFGETVTAAHVGNFKARFVNMMPSTDTIEVFSKVLNAVIFSGTRFKNASDWVEMPVFLKTDTLQMRKVSAPTVVLGQIIGFQPNSERVVTVYAQGQITATTGTRPRTLTSYFNR